MNSQTTPSTVVTRSTEKVTLYAVDSGASIGRIGVMIRVQIEPTTASRKILVWMRPFRGGSTVVSLGRRGGGSRGRGQIVFFRTHFHHWLVDRPGPSFLAKPCLIRSSAISCPAICSPKKVSTPGK